MVPLLLLLDRIFGEDDDGNLTGEPVHKSEHTVDDNERGLKDTVRETPTR